jgi:hypothetical protein
MREGNENLVVQMREGNEKCSQQMRDIFDKTIPLYVFFSVVGTWAAMANSKVLLSLCTEQYPIKLSNLSQIVFWVLVFGQSWIAEWHKQVSCSFQTRMALAILAQCTIDVGRCDDIDESQRCRWKRQQKFHKLCLGQCLHTNCSCLLIPRLAKTQYLPVRPFVWHCPRAVHPARRSKIGRQERLGPALASTACSDSTRIPPIQPRAVVFQTFRW